MAKIIEDIVIVRFSKLVKSDDKNQEILSEDMQQALEQVAQELVGDGVVVEVIKE
jgi:hypothetical protein